MLMTNIEYERIKKELAGKSFHTEGTRILNGDYLTPVEYKAIVENTRDERMAWWREARFGIFIHYGLYAIPARGEWAIAQNGYPMKEYEKLADSFMPKENAAEEWVLTAKAAGAKYVVLTTRHHDGFSLWNSKVNPYNSYNYGCKRDIVQEFVTACRKHDMKIGFYSSLMDWRHPDAHRMAFDPQARLRFLDYIEKLNTELLSNYGKIDILWYDMAYPGDNEYNWNSLNRDQKLRALQPDIIINERDSGVCDFKVREEVMQNHNFDWESCFTFNTLSYGYIDEDKAKNYAPTAQMLVRKLSFACRNRGNMLLNIGPRADGSVADYEKERLELLGRWLEKNKEVIYSNNLRAGNGLIGLNCYGEYGSPMLSDATAIGNTVYIWNYIWQKDGNYSIAGYKSIPKRVYFVDSKEEIEFKYDEENFRIILKNLPEECPDTLLGIAVIAMEFEEKPVYRFCMGYSHINDGHIEIK